MRKLIYFCFFLALLAPVFLSFSVARAQVTESTSSEVKARNLGTLSIECSDPKSGKLLDKCRDVSIFVELAINIARYLFSIIGALALLMLVYGGFMLILSEGNSERVKKGWQILFAAVVGLLISFSAYMLVRFLGGAVGLQDVFKLK